MRQVLTIVYSGKLGSPNRRGMLCAEQCGTSCAKDGLSRIPSIFGKTHWPEHGHVFWIMVSRWFCLPLLIWSHHGWWGLGGNFSVQNTVFFKSIESSNYDAQRRKKSFEFHKKCRKSNRSLLSFWCRKLISKINNSKRPILESCSEMTFFQACLLRSLQYAAPKHGCQFIRIDVCSMKLQVPSYAYSPLSRVLLHRFFHFLAFYRHYRFGMEDLLLSLQLGIFTMISAEQKL